MNDDCFGNAGSLEEFFLVLLDGRFDYLVRTYYNYLIVLCASQLRNFNFALMRVDKTSSLPGERSIRAISSTQSFEICSP